MAVVITLKRIPWDFNGTSSASPIISGAALIVQGMYKANNGCPLSPLEMRALLSDPATGTAQGGGVPGNIGVMPDLRSIIETILPRLVTVIADSGNFGEVCIGSFKDMVLSLSNSGGNMLAVTNITSSVLLSFLFRAFCHIPSPLKQGTLLKYLSGYNRTVSAQRRRRLPCSATIQAARNRWRYQAQRGRQGWLR